MIVNFNMLSLTSYKYDALDSWAFSSMAFAKQEGKGLTFECCRSQLIDNLKKKRKIYDVFGNNMEH